VVDKEIRINLIEKDLRVFGGIKNIGIGLFIGSLMLSGILYSYQYTRALLESLQIENERLRDEYRQAGLLLQDLEANKSSGNLLKKKINSVLSIQKSQTSTLEILEEIEKTMPPGMILIEIEIRMEKVTIKGYAPAHTSEALLLCGLRSSELFGEIIMVGSNVSEKDGRVLFEVAMAREGRWIEY